jgi:hypothetical protein
MRVIVRKERPPDAPRLRSPTPLTSSTFDEFEGGRRVAGHVRVAFQVRDAASTTGTLVMAGAQLIAEPTPTPWRSPQQPARRRAGLQLTLFSGLLPAKRHCPRCLTGGEERDSGAAVPDGRRPTDSRPTAGRRTMI